MGACSQNPEGSRVWCTLPTAALALDRRSLNVQRAWREPSDIARGSFGRSANAQTTIDPLVAAPSQPSPGRSLYLPRSRVGVLHSTAGSARTRRPSTIFQHETFDRKSTHAARVAKSRSAEPGERCPDPPSGSPVPSSTSIQVLRLAVGSAPVLSDLDPRRRLTAVRPNLGPFSSPNIRTPMALGSTCNWHCSSATDRCAGPRSRRPASSPTSPETISFVASRPPLRCR